jgi:hypothetical protein
LFSFEVKFLGHLQHQIATDNITPEYIRPIPRKYRNSDQRVCKTSQNSCIASRDHCAGNNSNDHFVCSFVTVAKETASQVTNEMEKMDNIYHKPYTQLSGEKTMSKTWLQLTIVGHMIGAFLYTP